MEYKLLCNKYKVSRVGIGGHYSKMEEGSYEDRYAEISSEEIQERTGLIQTAVEAGINYFDTTWQNEVSMLSKAIEPLNIRDDIFINGMVLGAFTGSEAAGMDVCEYFNKWLDARLKIIPGNHFDSFMINAIEERYDETKCEKLVRLLEKRRENGDFKLFGFSCHNNELARKVSDTFQEFELIMVPYNYKNRAFEAAFDGYKGKASFVAMKPLVWAEYGIPFCSLNNLPKGTETLGLKYADNAAGRAINWLAAKDTITTTVCAVNNRTELEALVEAGSMDLSERNEEILGSYESAMQQQNNIPFFISALYGKDNNRRMRFFGVNSLARALKVSLPELPLNQQNSDEILLHMKEQLLEEAKKQGYGELIG